MKENIKLLSYAEHINTVMEILNEYLNQKNITVIEYSGLNRSDGSLKFSMEEYELKGFIYFNMFDLAIYKKYRNQKNKIFVGILYE